MDCPERPKVRLLLTDDELQLTAIDDLCNKYLEWFTISKDLAKGRKTRSAMRRLDSLYEEIMATKLPQIQLKNEFTPPKAMYINKANSVNSSIDSDSESSRPITRSLRPRSRTPNCAPERKPLSRNPNAPCTPLNQRLRANMRQPNSGTSTTSSSSVLSAALNQQHPTVSVTKIRQVLRADSVQKKRQEEKERQERLLLDRKAKEERAEAQKRQLLEERAINAKLKREQRLMHAAELRKAREETRQLQKQKEADFRKKVTAPVISEELKIEPTLPTVKEIIVKENPTSKNKTRDEPVEQSNKPEQQLPTKPAQNINETFKKPAANNDNIEISIVDETTDETKESEAKESEAKVADWTRPPHLRNALIQQFDKPDLERHKEVSNVFPSVQLPVELEKIFGPNKAVNNKYYYRTSSAVWSPPNRALKRTSSMANLTPKAVH